MDTRTISTPLHLELGQLFSSNLERTAYTLNLYRRLYRLLTFVHTDNVSPELFQYCRRRNFFVNIIAYQGRRIFLKRSFGPSLGWELPGGAVRSRGAELYEDAVARIIDRDIPKVEIGELRPISYIEKVYRHESESVTHYGLTFLGRVRSPHRDEIEQNENIKGRFISVRNTGETSRIRGIDLRIFHHAANLITGSGDEHTESIDDEIESTNKISPAAKVLHKHIIHRISRRFSSRKIKALLIARTNPSDLILDVACGDDDFIFELARSAHFCVGNDVQWIQVHKLIDAKPQSIKNVVFTNHDACALPFTTCFDVVICKNLLHHMDAKDDLLSLLSSLRQVCRGRILIVDPEKPAVGPWKARLWNWYYVKILNDQGERFLTEPLFRQLITDFFRDSAIVDFVVLNTIKGNYMLAQITMNNLSENETHQVPSQLVNTGKEVLGKKEHNKKLVVFDLDGLLADTESLFFMAMRQALEEQGIQISEEEYVRHDLQNGTSLMRKLSDAGRLYDKDQAERRLHELYGKLLEERLLPMPGATAAIKRLRSRYRLALFTSSRSSYATFIINKLGIGDSFECVVSREMVSRFKPDPEGIIKVLELTGIGREESLVVEDSMRGLRAARAAGVACIVVPNRLTESDDYADADAVLSSLDSLSVELVEGAGVAYE